MIWKTDWKAQDEYSRQGVNDLMRLQKNYAALATRYQKYFAHEAEHAPVMTDGRRTYAFADLLNTVEQNLARLMAYWQNHPWEGKPAEWVPAGPGPTFEDINRWERNGQAVERALEANRTLLVYPGSGATPGEPVWVQNRFITIEDHGQIAVSIRLREGLAAGQSMMRLHGWRDY